MAIELLARLIGRKNAWKLGRRLYMAARGEGGNEIASNGEAALIRDVIANLSADGTAQLWDVGANLGLWTDAVFSAAQQESVAVHVDLFEPAPIANATLQSKFASRGDVSIHQLALSSKAGTAQFEMVGETAGTNSLNISGSSNAQTIDVQLSTGAEMFQKLGQKSVQMIKIDAEGHDLEVLRGLEPLLAKAQVAVVQFEYNWRWLINASSLRQAFGIAEAHGYRVGVLRPDGLEMFDSWNPENDRFFECNCALVHPRALARLRHVELKWDHAGNVPV